MYSPGIRSTIGGAASPVEKEDLIGTALADWVQTTGQQALTGSVKAVGDWWARSSADQEGIGDDTLRLIAGGVRNTTNAWKAATAEQEGIHDDILRGVGWTAGKGMQLLDAPGHYGGKGLSHVAKMVGVDPRIGGAVGYVGADLLTGGLIKKAVQITGTTSRLKRLRALGATDFQIDSLAKGKYAMAYGDKAPNILDDVITAARTSKKQRTSLKTLESNVRSQLDPRLNFLPKDVDLSPILAETAEIRRGTQLKIAQGTGSTDMLESALSTLGDLTKSKNDPRVYNVPKLRSKLAQFESAIEGAPALEWHHKNMKTLTTPYVEQMAKLVERGDALPEHVLNLAYISLEAGVGMGDRYSALLQLPKVAHGYLHKIMIAQGIQPSGTALIKYKSGIKQLNTVNDITIGFIRQIEEVSGPMTAKARILKQAYKGVDERLLDTFSGLTAERTTLRNLRSKLKGTKKNKQGLFSASSAVQDMSANRIKEIEARIKEIEKVRTPIKKQVLQVLLEKAELVEKRALQERRFGRPSRPD